MNNNETKPQTLKECISRFKLYHSELEISLEKRKMNVDKSKVKEFDGEVEDKLDKIVDLYKYACHKYADKIILITPMKVVLINTVKKYDLELTLALEKGL